MNHHPQGSAEGPSRETQLLKTFTSCLSSALSESRDHGGLISLQEGSDAASQLHYLISPSVGAGENCCSVPSMSLKHHMPTQAPLSSKSSLEQAAASNLSIPLEASRDELRSLPSTVVRNIADSFMSLVDSRIRSYLAALIRQSNKDPNCNLNPIVSLLAATSTSLIRPTAIVSTFRVLDDPSSQTSTGSKNICPLIQETLLDLNVVGQTMTVQISGTGNIIAVFDDGAHPQTIVRAAVMLETTTFLRSMMTQVREAVRRAVGSTTQLFLTNMPQQQLSGSDKNVSVATTLLPDGAGGAGNYTRSQEDDHLWLQQQQQQVRSESLAQNGAPPGPGGMAHPLGRKEPSVLNFSANGNFGGVGEGRQESKTEDNTRNASSSMRQVGGLALLTRAAGALGSSNNNFGGTGGFDTEMHQDASNVAEV